MSRMNADSLQSFNANDDEDGKPRHECGIAALYHLPHRGFSKLAPASGPDQVSRLMPRMLLDLQNRGQLAAGFSTFNPEREKILDTHKQIGTVIEAFRLNHHEKYESLMKEYGGRAAIGHVRYATCGANDRRYAQPFERYHGCKWKWFSFAFNGQLANFAQLRDELLSQTDYHLTRNTDTEIIMHLLSHALSQSVDHAPDLGEVFTALSQRFDGAFNLVFLNAVGDMVILRDPSGFRPLAWAMDGPMFAAASESVALLNLGFSEIHHMEPGDMIIIQNGEMRFQNVGIPRKKSHCFFEWIYFANAASNLDGKSVYQARATLGKELARQERALGLLSLDPKETVIVPVPDTAKAAADAMAHDLGIPSVEGLMRNRYVGRTFIEGQNRAERVQLKYTPLREVLEGKTVLLIEDTIVRSTTMKTLLRDLRIRGRAKEIHVRVACPPIIAPCFYGIDMSTVSELFAPKYFSGVSPSIESLNRMASDLGADSLLYLPLASIPKAIDLPESTLCMACINGVYPTSVGTQLYQISLANSLTKEPRGPNRTYERSANAAQPIAGPVG